MYIISLNNFLPNTANQRILVFLTIPKKLSGIFSQSKKLSDIISEKKE